MKKFILLSLFSSSVFAATPIQRYIPAPGTSGNVLTSNGSRWTSAPSAAGTAPKTLVWPVTANCDWALTNTSGAFVDWAADNDCGTPTVSGLTAPATKIPAFTYPSMPIGTYLILAQGAFYADGTSTCILRMTDGTTPMFHQTVGSQDAYMGSLMGIYTNASVADRTIRIQFYGSGTGLCRIILLTAQRTLSFSVIRLL